MCSETNIGPQSVQELFLWIKSKSLEVVDPTLNIYDEINKVVWLEWTAHKKLELFHSTCSLQKVHSSYCLWSLIIHVRVVLKRTQCFWWLMFQDPEQKSSSESSE